MACAYCKLPGHNSSTCPDPTGSQPTANNPVIEQYLPQLDDGPEQDGNWLSASARAWHIAITYRLGANSTLFHASVAHV